VANFSSGATSCQLALSPGLSAAAQSEFPSF
jgi:hypothetical protein